MPGASSLARPMAGFYGAPLADFVGAVDRLARGVKEGRIWVYVKDDRPCPCMPTAALT